MRSTRTLLILFGLLLPTLLAHAAALPLRDSQEAPLPSLAPMLERAVPAVVNIVTTTRLTVQQNPLLSDPFFRYFFDLPQQQQQQRTTQSVGSGVVIDAEQGLILTNNHVIADTDAIAINLADGRSLTAKRLGSDKETDIALLQVPSEGLQALPFGNSDELRVGDFVVAIGNPFGLGQTVTSGIVSALGRSGLGIEGYEDFIQTDASINPGNSGGALVNLRGELVGINTAILSKSGGNVGIGFAIPISMAQEIAQQLLEYGTVKRGQLGVNAQDITPELAAAFNLKTQQGAVVTQISRNSAADRAGLAIGDVIIAINGKPVRDASQIRTRVGLQRLGQKMEMTVMREGREKRLTLITAEPPSERLAGESINPRLKGVILQQQSEITPSGELTFVTFAQVNHRSTAYQAGIRAGDILTQVNRIAITHLDQLRQLEGRKGKLLLNIQRDNKAFFLLME